MPQIRIELPHDTDIKLYTYIKNEKKKGRHITKAGACTELVKKALQIKEKDSV